MDYLLLIAGLIMMHRRSYPWLFAIIMVLASTYLQLPLRTEMQLKIGPDHNVADTGLLLYIVFWGREVIRNGIYVKNPLQKAIIPFLLFLLLNGVYDLANGVSVGDIVRYLKNWIYLSLVFISPNITRYDVTKTIRIIYWITFCCCLILIIQYFLGVTWIGYTTMYVSDGVVYTRGAKPPSYVIVCVAMAFLNTLELSINKRILTCVVFSLSILLTLKMSYFATVCISLIVYYTLEKRLSVVKISQYTLGALLLAAALFTAFPVFTQRFNETMDQSSALLEKKQEKGNFTYRINHFSERLEYVLQDQTRSIRGLGYVQERNFHQRIFKWGQLNNWGRKAQLDTGDIAWSILIVRLGIVGILFFFYFYFACLNRIYRYRKISNMDLLFFSYMFASIFFMSFGNTLIANSDFYILPLLICITYENSPSYLEL